MSCAGGRFGSESKWRQNVADFGLSPFAPGKCARLVGNPLNAISDLEASPGVALVFIRDPFLETWWSSVGPLQKMAERFPYGYNVEPDH